MLNVGQRFLYGEWNLVLPFIYSPIPTCDNISFCYGETSEAQAVEKQMYIVSEERFYETLLLNVCQRFLFGKRQIRTIQLFVENDSCLNPDLFPQTTT